MAFSSVLCFVGPPSPRRTFFTDRVVATQSVGLRACESTQDRSLFVCVGCDNVRDHPRRRDTDTPGLSVVSDTRRL